MCGTAFFIVYNLYCLFFMLHKFMNKKGKKHRSLGWAMLCDLFVGRVCMTIL